MKTLDEILDVYFSNKQKCLQTTVDILEKQPFDPEINYPVIYTLTFYIHLEQARKLLEQVPEQHQHDDLYVFLDDFSNALIEANECGTSAWPLSVPWHKRWDGPHLEFPETFQNNKPSAYVPMKIESTEDGIAYLVGARKNSDGSNSYALFDFELKELQKKCPEITEQSENDECQFLEFLFYDKEYLVKKHQFKPFQIPNELITPVQPWIDERDRRIQEMWKCNWTSDESKEEAEIMYGEDVDIEDIAEHGKENP